MANTASRMLRTVRRQGMIACKGVTWALLVLGALSLATACESKSGKKSHSSGGSGVGNPGPSAPTLEVALARDAGTTPYHVIVTVTLSTASGAAAPGYTVTVSATDGTAGGVADNGDGSYTAIVTPDNASGEVPITIQATVEGQLLQQQRTALILPTIDPAWGQPEAVRGAVNTPGYEDGPNISPDGQWLVVTDTSPIDAVCCLTGCGGAVDSHSAYCQTVISPDSYGPPLRPNFPGASRIVDSTHILNKCPNMCVTDNGTPAGGEIFTPATAAFPPVASYLFKRQADGSFGEPTFVGYDSDGCNPPTGISFDGTPTSTTANLVYDWGDPTVPGHTQLWWAQVDLGTTNILGTCQCNSAYTVTVNNNAVALNMSYTQTNSNPTFRGGVMAFDNEGATPDAMFFAVASSDPLPAATFTPNAPPYPSIAVGNLAENHSQPFYQTSTNTLFFTKGTEGLFSVVLTGSDPANASHWGAETPVMLEDTSGDIGDIFALGQATIATLPGGEGTELYFVYIVRTNTANGVGTNANIGVIPKL